jgi:hypothetical protein
MFFFLSFMVFFFKLYNKQEARAGSAWGWVMIGTIGREGWQGKG